MNIVDSSGWLEYFSGGPNAEHFLPLIVDLLTPDLNDTEAIGIMLKTIAGSISERIGFPKSNLLTGAG